MSTEFMKVQTRLYTRLRTEVETTLSIGDMGDLFLLVLDEFKHDEVVITKVRALYESFYEEMYTSQWGA